MANRFIDTEFFKRPFVRSLKAPLKTLYAFIICDADSAGIWSLDLEIASIYVGEKIDMKDFETAFKGKYVLLENGQLFFPDFIEHQYPKGLQANNPAHKKAIERLNELNLLDESLKPLERPLKGSKVMVTDKVREKVTVKVVVSKVVLPFESDNFKEVWGLWKKERKERKTKKYTENGEQAALHNLQKISDNNENTAIEIINQSIIQGWQGLFPLNSTKNGKQSSDQIKQELFERYSKRERDSKTSSN